MRPTSDTAKAIAEKIVTEHNAALEYPKLLHMSEFSRYNRHFLQLAIDNRGESSLVDVYDAAEILQNKYGPQYHIPVANTKDTFS